MDSKDDLVLVADHLGDTAQAIAGLIEVYDNSKPSDKSRRQLFIAERLRLLAETLSPQHEATASQCQPNSPPEIMRDLLELSQRADAVVQKAACSTGLHEKLRVSVICEVSRLRMLLTVLASKILPGQEIVRFLEFPLEA